MSKTIRDTALATRSARSRLKPRAKPYYRSLDPGLHIGFRKPRSGAGKWVARYYTGDQAYRSKAWPPPMITAMRMVSPS